LLGLLRDEYERIPIFCISALTPPPPHSVLGQSFASSTTTLQSILNSGLLLSAASQLATAYLPLTTDYFGNTAPMSKLALPDAYAAIQRGEVYESATLLAWVMHLATAEYRLQPRTTNMAMTLAGLTQQTSANVLSVKMMTQLQPPAKDEEQTSRSQHRHASHSSSHQSSTPVVHTSSSAVPLSFLGHDVGFRVRADTPQPEEDERGREGARKECDVNQGLTESLHVFGRTEEMSHQQLIQTMEKQPTAMFRRVYGTSRVNLPPSFPLSYYDLLNEGHILSVSRCSTLGREIGQFGSWLTHLNRGGVTASHYTASSTEQELARVPLLLAHLQTERARNQSEQLDEDGDRTRGHVSEQLQMAQWSQQELDEFVECGTTLQNLSELY
jgi:hypothetical protein